MDPDPHREKQLDPDPQKMNVIHRTTRGYLANNAKQNMYY